MEEKKRGPLYHVLKRFVRILTPRYEIVGTENIPDEPCIIAGNHSQAYGPIAVGLYQPGRRAIWCDAEMLDRKKVPDYSYKVFWSEKPGYIRWLYRILGYLIAPLSEYVFNSEYTVPVYRDLRIIGTFHKSVRYLMEGLNIVIFPECYDEHNNIVHEFNQGFVDVASLYYRKTHKDLAFVPLYIAPYLKKMYYGEPVVFDHEAPIEEEHKRICGELMDGITEMAVKLPRHKVVPFPNVPKRNYPENI